MTRPRPRRSCLAVPASSPRKMQKAAACSADQVFFDLEDACAPSEKEPARGLVVEALTARDFGAKIRSVRVNGVTTRWCYGDLVQLVTDIGRRIDTIILPKVEEASHVRFVAHLLSGLERDLGLPRPIGLELLIESPRGAVALHEICRASPRIEAIIFGPGDHAANLGLAQVDIGAPDARCPGDQWHWVMSQIANHASAAGAQAIHGPNGDFNDERADRDSAVRVKLLGFDGKSCIHPNQIPWANDTVKSTPSGMKQTSCQAKWREGC
ncbi:MAG: citrate lyase subunit beta / citryl-CoA lyase [Solirubrobacteraceae bacterium]